MAGAAKKTATARHAAAKATPAGVALSAGKKIAKGAAPKARLATPGYTRILMIEFLVCFVVLGAGTVVAPAGSKDGVPRLMVRGTGLSILFFTLALLSSTGQKAGRAAAGLGGLVTAAYLFTSTDSANLMTWLGKFFTQEGVGAQAGAGAAAGAQAGTATTTATAAQLGSDVAAGVAAIGETITLGAAATGGMEGAAGGVNVPANPGGANKQGLT